MVYSMHLRHYLAQMQQIANEPLCLNALMWPFKIKIADEDMSPFLLVGHILDDLMDQKNLEDKVDPLDVASSAWELGYDPARKFLENSPFMIYNLLKNEDDIEKVRDFLKDYE